MNRSFKLIAIGIVLIVFTTFSNRGWRPASLYEYSVDDETMILAENLKEHVYKLSHVIGDRSVFQYESLNKARDYIFESLKGFGYKPKLQSYNISEKEVSNIIAVKPGTSNPDEIIIIGAHYDTCFNPGADDNASGVAGLLELAGMLYDLPTCRTIKFIAFTCEEPPFFRTEDMGSRVYARKARQEGENIKAVLIMEMIGYYLQEPGSQQYPPFLGPFYPNRGNFIAVAGNFQSGRLVRDIVRNFKKTNNFPIESVIMFGFFGGIDFSDHWSFWKEGYPAAMITDTAFYRNPNYHKASDTYDTLDYNSMAEVIKGLKGVLLAFSDTTKGKTCQ